MSHPCTGCQLPEGSCRECQLDGPFASNCHQSTLTRQVEGRGSILDEAKSIINGERQNVYGDPEDAFQLIASYWSIYLQLVEPLSPKDVMLMMVLFKLAREAHQGKRDNLRDAAGYLGLAGDTEGER